MPLKKTKKPFYYWSFYLVYFFSKNLSLITTITLYYNSIKNEIPQNAVLFDTVNMFFPVDISVK